MDIPTLLVQGLIPAVVAAATAAAFVARLDQRVKHLEDMGKEGREAVKLFGERLAACETILRERTPMVKRKSPISLTERGLNFLKDSSAGKFVDENFAELLQKIEALNPKTAYDVQEDAEKVIGELRQDDRLIPIKEFLFKDGSSLDEAVSVMSIHLRDKVLRHKNWNVADIDSPPEKSGA